MTEYRRLSHAPFAPGSAGVSPARTSGRLRSLDPDAIINLGLLLSIVTPVARVASAVAHFLVRRGRTCFAITGFVLLVLVGGFVVGAVG